MLLFDSAFASWRFVSVVHSRCRNRKGKDYWFVSGFHGALFTVVHWFERVMLLRSLVRGGCLWTPQLETVLFLFFHSFPFPIFFLLSWFIEQLVWKVWIGCIVVYKKVFSSIIFILLLFSPYVNLKSFLPFVSFLSFFLFVFTFWIIFRNFFLTFHTFFSLLCFFRSSFLQFYSFFPFYFSFYWFSLP